MSPVTKAGKRIQMMQMLGITLIPLSILLIFVCSIFSLRVQEYMRAWEVRNTLHFSAEVSSLIHILQKERDTSALYVSDIGESMKPILVEVYENTDKVIDHLTYWPVSEDNEMTYFQERNKFQNFLNKHRYELDGSHPSEKSELAFYTELIDVFMQWFFEAIKAANTGSIWKLLVTLQETLQAKEMLGIERAYGTMYYTGGGFASEEDYLTFTRVQDVADETLEAARGYSEKAEEFFQQVVHESGEQIHWGIHQSRRSIRLNPFPKNSTGDTQAAKHWFRIMSIYMDDIFEMQKELTEYTGFLLLEKETDDRRILAILGFITCFVMIFCPGILNAVHLMTDHMQRFSMNLVDR